MQHGLCHGVCVCIKGEQKEEMNDQQLNNLDLLCRYPLLKIKKSSSTGSNKVRAQVPGSERDRHRERERVHMWLMLLGLYHLQYRHGPMTFTPVHHSLPVEYLSFTHRRTHAHSHDMNPACQIRLDRNRSIAHSEELTKRKRWKSQPRKKRRKMFLRPSQSIKQNN